MLKATVVSPKQAEHYYRQENYYSKEESVKNSQWFGKGAEKLGLGGNIQGEDFSNLLYGNLPNGEKFRNRPPTHAKYKERAGVDLTFSAPKSVSLAVLVNDDKELEKAHRDAVETTLSIVEERYANTRIRDKDSGKRNTVTTGNLIVGQFHHDTSREKDPQLHTHAVIINGTQTKEGKWYSLNSDELFRQQKLLGTIYQNELAIRAQKLGYEIEQRENGQFDLKGYSQEHLDYYSKRRKQILEVVGEGASRKQIELAALNTRKPKGKEIPRTELQKYWQAEAKTIGIRHPQPNKVYQKKGTENPDKAIAEAIEHSSERKVNFKQEDLEKFVLSETGTYSWLDLQKSIENNQSLLRTKDQEYTTLPALNRELDTIRIVTKGNNSVKAMANLETAKLATAKKALTEGQRNAVIFAATTENRCIAWQGKAGAGKTNALTEFRTIAKDKGYTIKGYAPSASAAETLGEELGIETNTVARKLISKPLEKGKSQQQIWVIDEAGLLSAKDAHNLLKKAEEEKARILLVGDTRQLSAVEAGNPFKSLQKAGIKTAYLEQSLRQKTADLKAAVDRISDGRIAEGIKILDDNGRIEEVKDGERSKRIANEYTSLSVKERAKTLILAGTNQDKDNITDEIRKQLKEEGSLGKQFKGTRLKTKDLTTVQMRYAHHYQINDVIVAYGKCGSLEKNQKYTVAKIGKDTLTLKSEAGENIEFNPSKHSQKTVYEKKQVGIAEGDRLKWTKNDAEHSRTNGQIFTVLKVRNYNATIKYDNSNKIENVDLSTPQNFDHALVSTTFSSQGKTANRVLVSATSDRTLSQQSFYTAASRAKFNLSIYAQDKEQLLTRAQKSQAKLNPLEILEQHEQIKSRVSEDLQQVFSKYLKENQSRTIAETQQQKQSNKPKLNQDLEQRRTRGLNM